MSEQKPTPYERFELIRENARGVDFWRARDLQHALGYATWENFVNAIQRAKLACESAGADPDRHFREATKLVRKDNGARMEMADHFLSRYACYLIAMNGDPRKPEIGEAQTYFAIQTRRQEVQQALSEATRRFELRERVRKGNVALNSAAKQAGVTNYGLFHDAGYRGLYRLGLKEIENRKSIPEGESLLDCAGRAELAANEFRITQTEGKLVREGVIGEAVANYTHRQVGSEVRDTILKLGGTMPEDLPPEPSLKTLTKPRKRIRQRNSES